MTARGALGRSIRERTELRRVCFGLYRSATLSSDFSDVLSVYNLHARHGLRYSGLIDAGLRYM
jgi:hypothetical protein